MPIHCRNVCRVEIVVAVSAHAMQGKNQLVRFAGIIVLRHHDAIGNAFVLFAWLIKLNRFSYQFVFFLKEPLIFLRRNLPVLVLVHPRVINRPLSQPLFGHVSLIVDLDRILIGHAVNGYTLFALLLRRRYFGQAGR
jgi:hypothetical protein